ncbi:MAG: hypothetical protein DCC71_12945 [Proteobacteria bacterium]|nr:MAG: hypothetical protein DCC71_12945 [Pseudomonadota bacterium]
MTTPDPRTSQRTSAEPLPSVLTVANLVYALHAFAIVVGIAGAATVIGSFVMSLPSIAAVVLNYVKRSDARGTWVESHYRWQIRTFWFSIVWVVIASILFVTVIGIPLAFAILGFVTLWLAYRIGKGWLRLRDHRPMYD